MHRQLVANFWFCIAYLRHVQFLDFQSRLVLISACKNKNGNEHEKHRTTHREHDTRVVIYETDSHDSARSLANAREQLKRSSALFGRATFASLSLCRLAALYFVPRSDEHRAATLRRLIGPAKYVGLCLGLFSPFHSFSFALFTFFFLFLFPLSLPRFSPRISFFPFRLVFSSTFFFLARPRYIVQSLPYSILVTTPIHDSEYSSVDLSFLTCVSASSTDETFFHPGSLFLRT